MTRTSDPEARLGAMLPMGWLSCRIGDAGTVQLGRQRSPSHQSHLYPTPYIRAANITWQGLKLDDVLDMEFTPAERLTYQLLPGDILLSEASGSSSEVGKPAVWNGELPLCCFQNTVIRFRPTALVPRFSLLLFTHLAMSSVFANASRGVGIHHLGAQRFEAIKIPVPPLAEQTRIADRIDELFTDLASGVAALERVKRNLSRYRAAVLHAAVTGRLTEAWRKQHGPAAEPGPKLLERILAERRGQWEERTRAKYEKAGKQPPKNWRDRYPEPSPPKPHSDGSPLPALPKGWCWASVDQLVVEGLCNGISVKGSDAPPGVAALKLNAMSDHGFDYSAIRYIPIDDETAEDNRVHEGDFFASRGNGSLHLLARGTLAQLPPFKVVFPDTMIRLRLSKAAMWLPIMWSSRLVRAQIERMAKTTAGIYKVSQGDLAATAIPLPPLAEQSAIVEAVNEKLSQIDALEAEVECGLVRSSRLRQSILKAAFEGQLVPQDATDEPARVLLERIRTTKTDRTASRDSASSGGSRRPRKVEA